MSEFVVEFQQLPPGEYRTLSLRISRHLGQLLAPLNRLVITADRAEENFHDRERWCAVDACARNTGATNLAADMAAVSTNSKMFTQVHAISAQRVRRLENNVSIRAMLLVTERYRTPNYGCSSNFNSLIEFMFSSTNDI
ncbi:hypothetical protein WN51_09789 [Melipona quadrifasciata]|uniref:Uncharacterized protein n=1 Tax=Melipona quadrifasciata TaxID=166423 RepID=A0A0M9A566_9HYME|nr:hypothetical protein WN51_09789 [Melipona quadrifasciata]